MHKFLRAAGFSSVKKSEMQSIVSRIPAEYDRYANAISSENEEIVEYMKLFGSRFGVCVCGEYTNEGNFLEEYYYPFLIGEIGTQIHYLEVSRRTEKEAYAGICDEPNIGVPIIFYLQNMTEYLNAHFIGIRHNSKEEVVFSGLSCEGRILLPVHKSPEAERKNDKLFKNRSSLVEAARNGDDSAIETLTLEDMDIYADISVRVEEEDILSIVETSFMPWGIESDEYTIVGEILKFKEEVNYLTGETVVMLRLVCNKLVFDICINRNDLLGEPAVGRRFRGNVWIQGRINYSYDS